MSAILLHVVSNLSDEDMDVNVIPKFRMPVDTRFEYAQNAGVVDYLIVKCPKALSGENHLSPCVVIITNMLFHEAFLLEEPTVEFSNRYMIETMSSNIYEAKNYEERAAVRQAAMAMASLCRQHKLVMHNSFHFLDIILFFKILIRLSTYRGCVTSGESWILFVYNENENGGGEGSGSCSISKEMKINSDEGLAQIIGLLKDWVSDFTLEEVF